MPDLHFEFTPYPTPNILEVVREWQSIDFEPVYQRKGDVWDDPRRQYFIDSIINGVDLPKMYFHELVVPRTANGQVVRYGVIDGKQRLQAIRKFVDDKLPLAADFEFMHGSSDGAGGKTYSQLLKDFPELRARFDDRELPIVIMRTEDEGLIEGLFIRLNEGVTLNAPEKRNAFGGPIPIEIRDLVRHSLFTVCLPFDDDRYRHRDLAAKYLWIAREGRFVSTKKNDLDAFVKLYRNNPQLTPSPFELRGRTTGVLDKMRAFFVAQDPLLQSVGWATLYFHLFRLCGTNGPPKPLTPKILQSFVGAVTNTRHQVRAVADGKRRPGNGSIDPDLAQFDSLRQSPNDASALRTRYVILRRYLQDHHKISLPDAGD